MELSCWLVLNQDMLQLASQMSEMVHLITTPLDHQWLQCISPGCEGCALGAPLLAAATDPWLGGDICHALGRVQWGEDGLWQVVLVHLPFGASQQRHVLGEGHTTPCLGCSRNCCFLFTTGNIPFTKAS